MKSKRFASVFLLLTLVCGMLATPFASAEEGDEPAPIPKMEVSAQAALLVDGETGEVLHAQNEHQELYPASLTKIMTALLVLEAVDAGKLGLEDELTATATALTGLSEDGSSAGIKQGETMTVHNLLYCMLVVSANEACNILAERVAGSVSAFVEQMNARAQALGCKNTHFVNATGLHDTRHYTSAWDMYLMTKEALKHPTFLTICDTPDVVVPATNLSEQRHLYTTNSLISSWRALGYRYKYAHGVKTGSTSDAGHCLVSTATRNGRSLLSVVLGAEKETLADGTTYVMSFYETRRMFEWGFEHFSRQVLLSPNDLVREVPVALSREVSTVPVHVGADVEALLPNDLAPEDLERTVTLTAETARAPIAAGDVLGSITLSHDGKVYGQADLLAYSDVSASKLLILQDRLAQFFEKPLVRIAAAILGLGLLALAVWRVLLSRRRYRYGRRAGGRSRNYHGRRR